jgi:hypothetical protein
VIAQVSRLCQPHRPAVPQSSAISHDQR